MSLMRLSGTSMSAAVVSGAVLVMPLQARPSLTPAQAQMALQVTATFLPGAGLAGAGAGAARSRGGRRVRDRRPDIAS